MFVYNNSWLLEDQLIEFITNIGKFKIKDVVSLISLNLTAHIPNSSCKKTGVPFFVNMFSLFVTVKLEFIFTITRDLSKR